MKLRHALSIDSRLRALRRSGFLYTFLFTVVIFLFVRPSFGAKKPFTVADDVALAHFGDPYSGQVEPVTFSHNRKYFVVVTERGLLEKNRPESTLLVFDTNTVRRYIVGSSTKSAPLPMWTIRRTTFPDGPIIKQVRWLPDSSGFAFLLTNSRGYSQLFLADLLQKTIRSLTPADQYVTAYDIHTAESFVYIALSKRVWQSFEAEKEAASTVGTGRILYTLLFPGELSVITQFNDLSELWARVNGRTVRITERASGQPLSLHYEAWKVLNLSPDGRFIVTAVALKTVAPDWETSFAPKMVGDPYAIRSGPQDVAAFNGAWLVSEYARIDLQTGKVTVLTNAPIGEYAGWWSRRVGAAWTRDAQAIVVSNTFLPQSGEQSADGPCIAIVMSGENPSCLEQLNKPAGEVNDRRIIGVDVDGVDRVVVAYADSDGSEMSIAYSRHDGGTWTPEPMPDAQMSAVAVTVRQGLNDSPVLVAGDRAGNSRIILDPNPQLRDVELSKVSIYRWQDTAGRKWVGGLYKPRGYVAGNRYPLVIQTHGFYPNQFRPDGVYPTAFAAQELAASGIMVLQTPDCPTSMDAHEGPCSVALVESAVEKLLADGLVNPARIGIVGFSRTCFYVMEALTTSRIHFAAASITDGINEGYFQYLTDIDTPGNGIVSQANSMMGGAPFGPGFKRWVERSPEFNLEKITTPLQVVVTRRFLVDDWEPYAGLRILNKPVDLIVLRNGTHVLSNPGERLASQGGTVDWFRFWLMDVEDPSRAKVAQNSRWRHLRILQQNSQNQ